MRGHKVNLIGGPRDGEALETHMPPWQGSAFTITEGRYVVLTECSMTMTEHAYPHLCEVDAFFEPGDPKPYLRPALEEAAAEYLEAVKDATTKPSMLDEDQPFGRAVLGAIGGLMWGGVIFACLGIWAVGGWLINLLAERVGYTNLTIGLLIGGSMVGAVMGYFDARANQ